MTTAHLRRTPALIFCALTSTFVGCGDREIPLESSVEWLGSALAIDDSLVMIDHGSDRAFVLSLDPLASEATIVNLPTDPQKMVHREQTSEEQVSEVLVLSRGRRMSTQADADPSVLSAIDADGDIRKYTLGNPFDEIAQSEDGRYAVMFRTGAADRLLENLNEIAIVDLEADPGDDGAVTRRSLRSFGDSPAQVVFSPEMEILGEERRLAVIMSSRNVTLIDLNHLDRQETTVQLTQPGAPAVTPTQVVFSATEPKLYVRGRTADDLFVFDLTARPGGSESEVEGEDPHNDFRPTLNQLGVGTAPSDMALYGEGSASRLLTLTDGGVRAVVVDTRTGRPTTVALPTTAESILLFEAASPHDDSIAQRALVYRNETTTLTFIDLEDIEERGERNVDTLSLDQTIIRLLPMGNEPRVLVVHETGVSIVDLASRTVAPITASVQLQDALFDGESRRLWIGPRGQSWVGMLDVETGEPGELLLDAPIEQLVPVFDAGLLAVVHPSQAGYVSVIDVDHPERGETRSVRGFALSGILDRGEP